MTETSFSTIGEWTFRVGNPPDRIFEAYYNGTKVEGIKAMNFSLNGDLHLILEAPVFDLTAKTMASLPSSS